MLIELRDVWKSFGDKQVLRGADIQIRRGEAVGIIGGSGTGKSTTLRLMAGLMMPDKVLSVTQALTTPATAAHAGAIILLSKTSESSMWWVQGEVVIKGNPRQGLLADDPSLAKLLNVGMVFQNGALFDSLTVGQNVGFLLYEHSDLPHDHIRVRSGLA